jgi:hypothetical protein
VTTAAEPATGHRDRRDWLLASMATVGLLALFVAVQRGEITTYDSKIVVATAKAIAQGHLHLDPADDVSGRHLPYSHYGIGMPRLCRSTGRICACDEVRNEPGTVLSDHGTSG